MGHLRGKLIRPSAIQLAFWALLATLGVHAASAQEAPARTPEALIGKSIEDVARGKMGAALNKDIKALRSGPLLIHGNYCGIGNKSGAAPIDDLDAACMRHDACTRTGKLPSCACNERLRLEAAAFAEDPQTPADIKVVAASTASAMAVLICKTGDVPPPAIPPPSSR